MFYVYKDGESRGIIVNWLAINMTLMIVGTVADVFWINLSYACFVNDCAVNRLEENFITYTPALGSIVSTLFGTAGIGIYFSQVTFSTLGIWMLCNVILSLMTLLLWTTIGCLHSCSTCVKCIFGPFDGPRNIDPACNPEEWTEKLDSLFWTLFALLGGCRYPTLSETQISHRKVSHVTRTNPCPPFRTCPICTTTISFAQGSETVRGRHCHCHYHVSCAQRWFRLDATCPRCDIHV